jgi:multicomponent Na+:H+ antiporter subunit E
MISRISNFALWFIMWMLLSWPPDMRSVVIGIFAASIVYMMTSDMFQWKMRAFAEPSRLGWFIYYLFLFLWECLKANVDVAYRVIHPDVPIRPATIRVRTTLKSDIALTFLANSVTLTPGTTSVDIDKDSGILYVHCLYLKPGYKVSSMKMPLVERFEKIIRKIFE